MEKLELLAQRIESLIKELNILRDENARLKGDIKNLSDELELGKLEAEDLQRQIAIGNSAQNDICSRVDNLIDRIQAVLPADAPQQEGGQMQQAPEASPAF